MKSHYLIGIDKGTANTKAGFMDERVKAIGLASRPITLNIPQPGWAEQSDKIRFILRREIQDSYKRLIGILKNRPTLPKV